MSIGAEELENRKSNNHSIHLTNAKEIEASVSSISDFFQRFEGEFAQAPLSERKALIQKLTEGIEIDRERRVAKVYLLKLPKGESKLTDELIEKERIHLKSLPPTGHAQKGHGLHGLIEIVTIPV